MADNEKTRHRGWKAGDAVSQPSFSIKRCQKSSVKRRRYMSENQTFVTNKLMQSVMVSAKNMTGMMKLTDRLRQVEDVYDGFVLGVLTYVKKKPSRLRAVNEFMDAHPSALTSDIVKFIMDQDDFHEGDNNEQMEEG